MNDFIKNKVICTDMEDIFSRGYNWEEFDNKSVLITGAYGMLASYMVFFLIYLNECKDSNVKIFIQGRNELKAKERFGDYFGRDYIHYIGADILSDSEGLIPKTDYIVHAAGISNPRLYSTNPVEVIEPNVIGTHRLLKNCIGREFKSFLLFSTGDIYGKVEDSQNITEDTFGAMDPLDAHSCYGESKRLAESMCVAFYREYGVKTVIARIGHTYGPTMDVENDPRVFASFMKSALNGEDIVLHSDGLAKRPFCYISDAIAAYFLLLLKGASGEAYNVTNTDQFLSIRQVAQIVGKTAVPHIGVKFKERDRNDTYQVNAINVDNRPIETKLLSLGWDHRRTAEEGFARVYDYFKCERS